MDNERKELDVIREVLIREEQLSGADKNLRNLSFRGHLNFS